VYISELFAAFMPNDISELYTGSRGFFATAESLV